MRILGIDPGLDITGYGVIEESNRAIAVVEAGVIRTSNKAGLPERLKSIYLQLSGLIDQTRPDICIIEELYSHYKHPMTATLMAHSRGVVLFCCSNKDIGIAHYPAKTVKRSVTGNGNASKLQVQRVINKLLNLSNAQRPLDITDALALCITYLNHTNKDKGIFKR